MTPGEVAWFAASVCDTETSSPTAILPPGEICGSKLGLASDIVTVARPIETSSDGIGACKYDVRHWYRDGMSL
jgi:hypothetical protein